MPSDRWLCQRLANNLLTFCRDLWQHPTAMKTKLQDYLDRYEISELEFARATGLSRQIVFLYRTGQRVPEWGTLLRIMIATGGEVGPIDWVPVAAQLKGLSPAEQAQVMGILARQQEAAP